MITSSILVMIGYVREIRHMYRFAMPTLEDFLKVSIIYTMGDVDWVCLAPDRKEWEAPPNVVMSVHVV